MIADQGAAGWNFDVLGDDLSPSGNHNVPKAVPADAYIVRNVDQLRQSLIADGRHVGESRECVALVKHAIPEVGVPRIGRKEVRSTAIMIHRLSRGRPWRPFITASIRTHLAAITPGFFSDTDRTKAGPAFGCWSR